MLFSFLQQLLHYLFSMQIHGHPGLMRFDLLIYHSKQCFEIGLSPLVIKYTWQKICKGREPLFKMMSNTCELHQNE